jgi:hypothetical protein
MSYRDTWNSYQWEGSYGDPDGDEQDRWSRRRRLGPEFPFTLIARCKSCDGFFPDMRAYAGQIVSDTRATTCHHCRGEVPCAAGKHLVKPGAVCWVCEVYKADPSK